MKKIWVVAMVAAMVCGVTHFSNADTGTEWQKKSSVLKTKDSSQMSDIRSSNPSQVQMQYCEAAMTVLSSTKSKVAFDAFLASIGNQCDRSISLFACKVKLANAKLASMNLLACKQLVFDEQVKNKTDEMVKSALKDSNTFTVTPTIDPKVLRQPAIDSAGIQSILIGTGLGKTKPFCEAAKILLSSTKSEEGFYALLDEIGKSCDASIPGFECVVLSANKVLKGSMTKELLLVGCSVIDKGSKGMNTKFE